MVAVIESRRRRPRRRDAHPRHGIEENGVLDKRVQAVTATVRSAPD
jgi:hypothetical protein